MSFLPQRIHFSRENVNLSKFYESISVLLQPVVPWHHGTRHIL